MYDLVIRGANVVSASTTGCRDVAVWDGRIAAIAPAGELGDARQVFDAHGCTLIPGLIDAHVHFRDPALPHRETFETGSAAAAAGGVTTVLEMPTSQPSVTTLEILRDRAGHLANRSVVDFGLYAGAGPGNLAELQPLADAGVVAFKTFTHAPPADRIDALGPLCVTASDELFDVLRGAARTGVVHALHCEDDAILAAGHDAAAAASDLSLGARHALARPALAEEVAVVTAAAIARAVGARVHFVHISHPDSVRHVCNERLAGLDASVESCPHYLAFNQEALFAHGAFAKCNPPLREESARQALARAVGTGDIDIISSDHCPNAADELLADAKDPSAVPAGLAGIEFMLPTLLTLVDRGELALSDMVRATAANPARRFGLSGKGDIQVGYLADLVAVDRDARWSFRDHPLHSKGAPNSHYLEEITFAGSVVRTWLRGGSVFEDGHVTGTPGDGVWVRRGRVS